MCLAAIFMGIGLIYYDVSHNQILILKDHRQFVCDMGNGGGESKAGNFYCNGTMFAQDEIQEVQVVPK